MTGARRFLYAAAALALSAWVLVPIYLIGLGAFGGRPAVFKWPKSWLPVDTTLGAMAVFLRIEGVWNAALNSVIAACLTMAFSIALGAPAGYALARFSFRGANAFRLMILLTRAFPLAILALPLTVIFIRVEGANISFTEDGQFHSILDAVMIRHLISIITGSQEVGSVNYISGSNAGLIGTEA